MSSYIKITFMRHGRSRADDEKRVEGRYDSPLTEVGRSQAEIRAKELKSEGIDFDVIIASSLVRASETAEIIGGILGVEVQIDEDWMEIDNGPVAGLPREEALKRYPLPDFQNPFDPLVVSANAGESAWALHCRAVRALEKVIRRGPGQYLVISHGGILNAALGCVVGAPPPVRGQGVNFNLGDTGYIRTYYVPGQHLWAINELKPGE
jgi:2,3-bisphosphoglycerate-dependent phosphoglycerate mutase